MLLGKSLGRLIMPAQAAKQPITIDDVYQSTPNGPTLWYFSHPVVVLSFSEDPNILVEDELQSGWYPVEPIEQLHSHMIRFACQSAPVPELLRWQIAGTPAVIAPADPALYYIALAEGQISRGY